MFGVPYVGPYNVNSIMNWVLAMCMALGYLFNFYLNKPIVRQGGVGIFYHPLPNAFHLYRTSHAFHGVHPFYMW
ncbi:hypothetical protein [Streptomyces mirabilis]